MSEREIVEPVPLVGNDASLHEAARGYTRRPLHDCALAGPWGRRKRWHYWAVTSAREIVSLTFADLDYLALGVALVIDRPSGRRHRALAALPLGHRDPLPARPGKGTVALRRGRFELCFDDRGSHVSLSARGRRLAVDVEVERPARYDSLGVAVGWAPRRFAYSAKQVALPARGTLLLDGVRRPIADGAFACLDFGRGVWPWRTAWNWASAAGVVGGRTLGLNLGARWTAGAGPSENALLVDGQLEKIAGELAFDFHARTPGAPWHIHGPDVELVLEPEFVEHPRLELGLVGAELHLAFGTFRGRVLGGDVGRLFGWAEAFRARW